MKNIELEGKLILHRSVVCVDNINFRVTHCYYTVLEGVVYEISGGMMTCMGDDVGNLKHGIILGDFDESVVPVDVKPINFTYDDLLELQK